VSGTKDNLRFFWIRDCALSSRSHHILGVISCVVASVLLWAGAGRPLAAQDADLEESSSIHGTVVNSVTNEPIGRALVFSPDNRFATMTDDHGRFEFVLAKTSQQKSSQSGGATPVGGNSQNTISQLAARKPGFLDEDEGGQRWISVAQEQKDVTLWLTPESLVVGHVVLPDESDRIRLEIYRRQVQEGRAQWIATGRALTNSNGEFRFAGLRAGKYKLLTYELLDRDPLTFDPKGQVYGYPPAYFPSDLASEGSIDLATGATFQASLTPVRQAYYQVRVPVANAAPGAQIQVNVAAQGHHGPGFSLGYNQQDQRIEGQLPEGSYAVEALNYGPPASAGSVNITVKGGAVQGPAMVLVPSGTVAVNVKEEFTSSEQNAAEGAHIIDFGTNGGRTIGPRGPRRYLNIMLLPADEFSLENVVGLAPPSGPGDEALLIPNVQPGRYWVQVNSSRGFPAAITSGGNDLLHHPLVVGWGGAASPIEITMHDDWAQIGGKIEQPDDAIPGTMSQSAWVCLVPTPDSPGQFKQLWLPREGELGDQQIAPGEYRALAFDRRQPELEYSDPEAMRAYDGKGLIVRLVAGQKERITLPLISTGESP
jgi:hypothetical protein